ncbi:MAG: hypothetical protein QOJ65_811 [Fimbriimonadaceae bacterium]|nr:hypothetical protein [Fimbriimonadaceae bacterium]
MRTQFKSIISVAGALLIAGSAFAQTRVRPFNLSQEGSGTVRIQRRDDRIRSVQLTLQGTGRVTIRAVRPEGAAVFTGKWSRIQGRNNAVDLNISTVSDGNQTDYINADGHVELTSRGFNYIELHSRNTDRNDVSLRFSGNGHYITDYRDDPQWRNRYDDRGQQSGQWQGDSNSNRSARGSYTDMERWRRGNEEFIMKYSLDLRGDGTARLVVSSEQDRNMPNDASNRRSHGDIIKYMHQGHDIIQTGTWSQNGSKITLRLDRIQYGSTRRDKNEVVRAHVTGNVLYWDEFDKAFYGRNARLGFERSGTAGRFPQQIGR